MELHPLADRIVMQQLEAEETTASGIVLPGSAQEKPKMAKVISVGKDVKEVKANDQVIYKSYGPDEVKIDKVEYLVCKEEDILAIVKGDK
ncbi:MAG: co-chaperone GroES [bacterium]